MSAAEVDPADPRTRAWAYLSRVAEGAHAPLQELIGALGPEHAAEVLRSGTHGPRLPRALSDGVEARRMLDRSAQDLEILARRGGRLITPDSLEWPGWRMRHFAAPAARNGRRPVDHAAPVALWAVGTARLTDIDRAVAVVGTRAASGYGEHVTAEIAGDLAADGYAIVSGAAYGVDAVAHRAALARDGLTVAVLACGIDRVYPAGNAALLRGIAERGLVVSEYPPGTTPARYRFLGRNRLIAALADAVAVPEAGLRSGARNTVSWARRFGLPVCAVPGPVTSATSVGCHRMIAEGIAHLVVDAAQIAEAAGPIGALAPTPHAPERITDPLTADQRRVYDGFPASAPITVEELSVEAGLPVRTVLGAVAMLEVADLIVADGRRWRLAPVRPARPARGSG